MLAVKLASKNGMLPENTRGYVEKWEHKKVIGNDGKKVILGLVTLNENEPYCQKTGSHIGKHNKETTLLINVACPSESNKTAKREEKKVSKVMFKLQKRWERYTVSKIPTVTECFGGRIKELKENI